MISTNLNAKFIRQPGTEVGSLGKLQCPVVPLPISSSLGQVEAANSAIFGTRVRVGEIADYVMDFVDREVWSEAERARPKRCS